MKCIRRAVACTRVVCASVGARFEVGSGRDKDSLPYEVLK